MEEEKKLKSTKAKNSQVMATLVSNTIRGIVNSANNESIQRSDVVSILKENGQFILIYYK